MATVIDSVSIVGLRKAHFEQLLTIVKDHDKDGSWWQNKKQHYRRNNEITGWLEEIVDMLDGDTKIKGK